MFKLSFITAVLVTAVAAPSARADRFEVSAATGARWATGDSVDALSGDDEHNQSGLGVAMRLDGIRPLGLDLAVEADYDALSLSGTTFGRIESELSTHSLQAGARLTMRLSKRTSAFGRAAIGYTTGKLSLDDRFAVASRATSDRAHAGSTTLGGGGSVIVASGEKMQVGLRGYFDYTKTTAMAFEAAPEDAGDDALQIATTSASLGDVDISGWSLRIGLFAAF